MDSVWIAVISPPCPKNMLSLFLPLLLLPFISTNPHSTQWLHMLHRDQNQEEIYSCVLLNYQEVGLISLIGWIQGIKDCYQSFSVSLSFHLSQTSERRSLLPTPEHSHSLSPQHLASSPIVFLLVTCKHSTINTWLSSSNLISSMLLTFCQSYDFFSKCHLFLILFLSL